MKKIITLCILVLSVSLYGAEDIKIGTGGTAGTYYPLGGVFAEIWNANIEGINAAAESTGGSVANIKLLEKGDVGVALVQNDVAYYAENGVELFKEGKVENIRGIATLYSEPIQLVTTDPTIKTIADLKGKNVAIGDKGSGVSINATQILTEAGILDDIKPQYLSFGDAANGLKDGQVDVAFLVAGAPTSAVTELSAQKAVYIIPIDGELAAKVKAKYSYYADYLVKGGTYSTEKEDKNTLTVKAMLISSDKLSEEVVYNMLKTIYENKEKVEKAHAVGKFITEDTGIEAMSIKLHPGAEKYFSEKGKK